MGIRYVLIVQCDNARRRCSGFACAQSFYDRTGFFSGLGYPHGARYLAVTCGGCCGGGLAAYLEHFSKKLARLGSIKKEDIAVHLSSCITTDNHHHDRCPHLEYIKQMILKKGFNNIVEGTYRSARTEKMREAGQYKDYAALAAHKGEQK